MKNYELVIVIMFPLIDALYWARELDAGPDITFPLKSNTES